jgi:mannose-6-phosphate isomerase
VRARPLPPEQLRDHLLRELLPLWWRHGHDAELGGFHGRLERDLRPAAEGFKRALVQARQVIAFSAGYLEGAEDFALEAARAAWRFLMERCRDPRHGGFYLTTDPAGAPLDRSKDLYVHAFVLLACAWYVRAAQELDALEQAARTFALLEERLVDPAGVGYLESASEEWTPRPGPRGQNAHMHLFEALLALFESSGDGRYLEAARRLLELCQRRFVDPEGRLFEHYDQGLERRDDAEGRVIEPGHQFEWSALLCAYARLCGDPAALDVADRLYRFAAEHGLDREHGGVYDAIAADGAPLRPGKRLWPQTEHLRALAARALYFGDPDAIPRLREALALVTSRYLDPQTRAWHEQAAPDGRIVSDRYNATSLYHITTAALETCLVLDAQGRGEE